MTEQANKALDWEAHGFTNTIGVEGYRLHEDGSVSAELELDEGHLNMGGITHGGVLTTLLDSVMGGTVVRVLEEDEWCATMQLNTEFIRPAQGTLRAVGELDRRGGLTAYAIGKILDEDGELVARATGIWAIRKG